MNNDDSDLISELQKANHPPEKPPPKPKIMSICNILQSHQQLKVPLVDGLIRIGETCNVIAAPKTGKSFLSLLIALSIAIGKDIFGFKTTQGKVLILDNELHPETLSSRIPMICEANDIDIETVQDNVDVDCLRGRLIDIRGLSRYLDQIDPNKYSLIILDALYRFMPSGASENDNGFMTEMYNILDNQAKRLNCAFMLIHHTSKGSQAGKATTDKGSGAGAQSRAADCHIALTPHEEDDAIILNAVCRSFPPPKAFCIRYNFPAFELATDLDPTKERQPYRSNSKRETKEKKPALKPLDFVQDYISEEPQERELIIANAIEGDISRNKAEGMIKSALAKGYIYQHQMGKHNKAGFATVPPNDNPEN